MKLSSTERFSSRVTAYLKYRPSYPKEIISYLKLNAGLKTESIVADIGSGTGFLSKLFLDNGNIVLCVEPNKAMREAAEMSLKKYKNFVSIDGTAENTRLENNSVDFIVAGQAFHWFNPLETKKEFQRIIRPKGKTVLIWNERDIENDEFQKEYEKTLTRLIPEYSEVKHTDITIERIKDFTSPLRINTAIFNNLQVFDFDSLIGRLLSSSYCPDEKSELFQEVKNELLNSFNKHQINGLIKFPYQTKLYWTEQGVAQ